MSSEGTAYTINEGTSHGSQLRSPCMQTIITITVWARQHETTPNLLAMLPKHRNTSACTRHKHWELISRLIRYAQKWHKNIFSFVLIRTCSCELADWGVGQLWFLLFKYGSLVLANMPSLEHNHYHGNHTVVWLLKDMMIACIHFRWSTFELWGGFNADITI